MTSSRQFKDASLDVREIGTRLTADYLLEGEITGSELNSSAVTLTPGAWAPGSVTAQTQGGNVMTG